MLVAPAATASLLTDRLPIRLVVTLAVAFTTALLGHAMALTLPALVFSRLGFPEIKDASTAGMMAVVAGMLFILAMFFAPRHGMISKGLGQTRLAFRLACHDQLRSLYQTERKTTLGATLEATAWTTTQGSILHYLATWSLIFSQQIARTEQGHQLTSRGKRAVEQMIRDVSDTTSAQPKRT